jgi:signal transduction histidine kinase
VRLAEFIAGNIEPILTKWESFARSIWPPGIEVEPVELRDSAAEILAAVINDMNSAQTSDEQSEKSMGRGGHGPESECLDHASQVHGTARVGSGLALDAVVSEHRALRASVLRLWTASTPQPDPRDIEDMTRFNEAIDQSLAHAVAAFARRVDTTRNMFLGVLGHDLRSPLTAITLTAKTASRCVDPDKLPEHLDRIAKSAAAINDLITDLMDFTTSMMGRGLPLSPVPADLRDLCDDVVREMRVARSERTVLLSKVGNCAGVWDPHRLRQLMTNLLGNALQHGASTEPVDIQLNCTAEDSVTITVHNHGHPIPAEILPTIFNPLVRGTQPRQAERLPGSVGLGLYIVREIATAHGGTAEITSSSEGGTTVTVRLPRHAVPGTDSSSFS